MASMQPTPGLGNSDNLGNPLDGSPGTYPVLRHILAWLVHLYTASGLLLSLAIAMLIVRGDSLSFGWAFLLMMCTVIIDSTDGFLARAVQVKKVLPGFDGRRLDDLVDFLTYAFLPLLLLQRAGIPGNAPWIPGLCLLAAAYGFCQADIKTDDGFFLGFPSYWNVIAFYLYALQPLSEIISFAILGSAFVLTFVPTRYLYPSQPGLLNRITILLAVIWGGIAIWVFGTWIHEHRWSREGLLLSLFFPVYYMLASFAVTFLRSKRHSPS